MEKKERIAAIDLGRGIGVLLLTCIHTLWMYADMETQTNTWAGQIIHILERGTGGFLIAMGFSFVLSRNQKPTLAFKRGLMLLVIGYGMNFLKFIVPVLAGFAPENFIAAYGWTSPVSLENMLFLIQTGDILQLAGLSLFFLGLINACTKNKYAFLIMALLVVILAPLVRGIRVDLVGIDYLLDLLWGAEWNVYFPVFPWMAFILVGMFFGQWYKEKEGDVLFIFRRMLWFGAIATTIGVSTLLYNYEYHFGDFFHLGPGGAVYLIGNALIIFWVMQMIVTYAKPNRILNLFYYASKRVTTFYVVQWVLICWGMGVFGFQQLGITSILLLIPLMTFLTFIVDARIGKIQTWFRKVKREKMVGEGNNISLLPKG